MFFYDKNDQLTSLPAQWTSIVPEDSFVTISAGRAHFRVEDLLRLAELIDGLRETE